MNLSDIIVNDASYRVDVYRQLRVKMREHQYKLLRTIDTAYVQKLLKKAVYTDAIEKLRGDIMLEYDPYTPFPHRFICWPMQCVCSCVTFWRIVRRPYSTYKISKMEIDRVAQAILYDYYNIEIEIE